MFGQDLSSHLPFFFFWGGGGAVFYLPFHVSLSKILRLVTFFLPNLAGFFLHALVLTEAYIWVKLMSVGRNFDNMNSKERSCHVCIG